MHVATRSMIHLPLFDGVDRVDQHDDVEQQVVADPEEQDHFRDQEEDDRLPDSDPPRECEAEQAGGDVAE